MSGTKESYIEHIQNGYQFKGASLHLGAGIFNGEVQKDAAIKIPLKTLNRHGLIAGATGTGKTKTLQVIAEQMSMQGIPTLLMDIKGDLSGMASAGTVNDKILSRHEAIGIPYHAEAMPVELLSISGEKGVKLRATVSEFGPVLFSKILDLNDTQQGMVAILFKYSDDHNLPLLDLKDFKKLLQYASEEGKADFEREYGRIAGSSASTILRKIIEIEQQGADAFFGERSFDVQDLLQIKNGKGVVNIIRLTDIQDKPKLFSTFMLCLLAEVYSTFPEAGDVEKPKLCIFIDEAHLVFNEASKALLDQIESIIKLIRSKGVGIFFCTQTPTDVPDAVLGQLGLKVQHALRAFTAKDRKDISKTAENYPLSDFYNTEELLTQLGIGEALVTALDEKGRPSPLAAVMLQAPKTRMDVLSPDEINVLISSSDLVKYYNEEIDRESAFEILNEKLNRARNSEAEQEIPAKTTTSKPKTAKPEPTFLEQASKNTMVRQIGRTVMSELTRGLLGVLGIKSRRR
jgi:hypothetical protein